MAEGNKPRTTAVKIIFNRFTLTSFTMIHFNVLKILLSLKILANSVVDVFYNRQYVYNIQTHFFYSVLDFGVFWLPVYSLYRLIFTLSWS